MKSLISYIIESASGFIKKFNELYNKYKTAEHQQLFPHDEYKEVFEGLLSALEEESGSSEKLNLAIRQGKTVAFVSSDHRGKSFEGDVEVCLYEGPGGRCIYGRYYNGKEREYSIRAFNHKPERLTIWEHDNLLCGKVL